MNDKINTSQSKRQALDNTDKSKLPLCCMICAVNNAPCNVDSLFTIVKENGSFSKQ